MIWCEGFRMTLFFFGVYAFVVLICSFFDDMLKILEKSEKLGKTEKRCMNLSRIFRY